MQIFIKRTLAFIFILMIYFTLISIVNINLIKNQDIKLENKRVLIIGDSHPQTAVNPDYLSSAQNISQEAEPYVLTYWKLKTILNHYRPDTILLGFAPHNISAYNDSKFSDEEWTAELFKRSYTIEKFNLIDEWIPVDYKAYYKSLFKQLAFYPKQNHTYFIGNYTNKDQSDVSDWLKHIIRHYYLNDEVLGVSSVSVAYLDSILNLCHQNNITPILITNPVQQKYLENIPIEIMSVYDSIRSSYTSDGIMHFYQLSQIYPDSHFLNADHINENGSKVFTNELRAFINKTQP